ncbi:hypothetical protein GY21_07245 [Cryobacterium roopkundense]|uniref:DUF6458 domain-containing protein n=1 Tax=Cryobacterium roopkundense TaxID=1001240 RepID=A0A099JHL9_9MICO|nr:DUF6458 family protein [Cryobacterium roopkundense]KGJ77565.1 hypothetical protein GY21_07245 [Cryobacterium roopkundense]MBB5641721.1 hypothetical protein [Cryobacterium roopkundense]
MSIGLGIFLFVVGAVLVWALNVSVTWIDLDFVGYIMMGAGAIIFVIGLIYMFRKHSTVSTVRTIADPANGQQVTRKENSVDGL